MSNSYMTSPTKPLLELLQRFARLELSATDVVELNELLVGVDNWQTFLAQAELYTIANFVLRHAEKHDLAIPKATLLGLKALSMRHRAAADARYQLLQELLVAFEQKQIPIVGLKGVALAVMIYPAEELRPMRDIDLLVAKHQTAAAGEVLRDLGFDLPTQQPSKYMRASHQLPNATKQINGFTISVEIHHDALASDVRDHLFFEQAQADLQRVNWRDVCINTLAHETMLHQVSRHLEGLHPGAVLKLINVMDVVLYSEQFISEIDWGLMKLRYPHVLNTLKCLSYISPLSDELRSIVGGASNTELVGVGEIMLPLSHVFNGQRSLREQWNLLFCPSDWWLHLYYNVDPASSLIAVKLFKHPLTIAGWILKRLYSRVRGG